MTFFFKRNCLFCGNECKPNDSYNPQCWVQVRQCTTLEIYGDITFKQDVVNIYDERQNQWAQKVAVRVSGVIDLHAAAAQEALRSVVMTMAQT